MTVAVMVKVHDGIVLAADSATTVRLANTSSQVYNNADKVFNVHRKLPVAAMTWGLGHIGVASISTLCKDLRSRLMGDNPAYEDWALDPKAYTIREVADRVSEMLHDRLRAEVTPEFQFPAQCLGMLVAGYSAGAQQSEAWLLLLDGNDTQPPAPIQIADQDSAGWKAFAQPSAADRLFNGYDNDLLQALLAALPAEHHETLRAVLQEQNLQPVFAPMPFPDAIALARYLVDITAGWTHFLLGPDIVGGPTEVAGVNRHEGFKWISRKHYYTPDLNQGVH